ncbi:hypothetical protein [Halorussus caseinilyticus]|uniref:Uncharacterized protein n=1 Tax=Halorussus caseinilyticus TaxID=3034025 RepID=A0ABD5WNI7_9EURY|nr:hypothetical protein [Halorussus sp. DT72]
MTTSDSIFRSDSDDHPLVTEFAFVVGAAAVFSVAFRAVAVVSYRLRELVAPPGRLLADGLFHGTVMLVVLGLVVGAYATWRGIDVRLTRPTREDLPAVVAALAVPALLVALTALVGGATGASYSSLARTSYAADVALRPVLVVTGLGLFVGVPSYLLLCQVVVQGSFGRVVGGDAAAVLTTATAGFLLVGTGGGTGLSAFPDRGRLVGAALFTVAVGVAAYAIGRTERPWVRYLAAVPALALAATVVVSAVAAVESPAGALFAGTQLVVLGLAAFTYERTDSLAVPALAYLGISLAHDAAVFAAETGVLG